MPALLGLTFFGILHVPINVPTLAMTTGTSRPNIDKELRNHAAANILSGACGRSLARLESTKRCRAEALQLDVPHSRLGVCTHCVTVSLQHSELPGVLELGAVLPRGRPLALRRDTPLGRYVSRPAGA